MPAGIDPFGPRPAPAAVQRALDELDGLLIERETAKVKRRSRDSYAFSPILERELDGVCADAIVAPTSVEELKRIATACWRHDVPVTVRGGGSGTGGQAMPLRGGILVDMGYLNHVIAIEPGWCRAQAGCVMGVLDAALHERGQALRVHPGTLDTATIGGFVATGGGGVGSITWGSLRDIGAVRAVRVMTVEASPRLLELRGAHVALVVGGSGTTGIITEVELPTTAATRWAERVVGFADFEAALRFAHALAHEDAILKRLVSVVAAPAPARFLFPHGVDDERHVVLVMVADTAVEAFDAVLADHLGECLGVASSPLFELAWHHTTWQARKHDRQWTDLQATYPAPGHVATILDLARRYRPREVIPHVEFLRSRGQITAVGLPLVRFTTEARLGEIIADHDGAGAHVCNPHVLTLEAMRREPFDRRVLAFKREVDSGNLLNPGKMASVDATARQGEDLPASGFKRP